MAKVQNTQYEWKNNIQKFIEQKCVVKSKVRIAGYKLYEAYMKWFKSVEPIKSILISQKQFGTVFKECFPQFTQKRFTDYKAYLGICLREHYSEYKEVKKYEDIIQRKREYHQQYYQKNKNEIQERHKKEYRIRCSLDRELISRTGMNKQQFFVRKRLGLIHYVFNIDNSVNWCETINKMNQARQEYIRDRKYQLNTDINILDKEIECHKHNMERYFKYGDVDNSYISGQLVYQCEQRQLKLHKKIRDRVDIMQPLHSEFENNNEGRVCIKLKIVSPTYKSDGTNDGKRDEKRDKTNDGKRDETSVGLLDKTKEPSINPNNITKYEYVEWIKWYKQQHAYIWKTYIHDEVLRDKLISQLDDKYDLIDERLAQSTNNTEDINTLLEIIDE